MTDDAGAYARTADTLRDNGYHVLPIQPGTKVPGKIDGGTWKPMGGWQQWCNAMPPEFMHSRWSRMPHAGVCVAHGDVVGLDVDTDRKDVADAVAGALPGSPARRRGAKGYLGYYRAPAEMPPHGARVRWYEGDKEDASKRHVVLELLMRGSQSVLPPSMHPDCPSCGARGTVLPPDGTCTACGAAGRQYQWITPDSLEDITLGELPELPLDAVELLDKALAPLGIDREAPRRKREMPQYTPALQAVTSHDLEKPRARSVNDRALEPDALAKWWPALNLPKSRQRGAIAWEGVAFWRESNSGRPLEERNPNLKVTTQGIVDFGDGQTYTPINVVIGALGRDFEGAIEWLEQYIRPEEGLQLGFGPETSGGGDASGPDEPEESGGPEEDLSLITLPPAYPTARPKRPIRKPKEFSRTQYNYLIPSEPGAMPIGDAPSSCVGLLGQVAGYFEEASPTLTTCGGLAVALPVLGVLMGRAFASQTNLRTNIYTVALGSSGSGKTSLVAPAKGLLSKTGNERSLGQDQIMSGSGLMRMLADPPHTKVVFLDEFGHMLQQISKPGAGAHAAQIVTEFTRLYSAAGTHYTGAALATRDPEPIECPHLCIFGMATPDQFWRAFGSSNLEDGSVARYLIFPLEPIGLQEPDHSRLAEVSSGLAEVRDVIKRHRASGGNLANMHSAMTVRMSSAAERMWNGVRDDFSAAARFAEREGIKGAPSILMRVAENAVKIALISAVGRAPSAASIDQHDFEIGYALAKWSAEVMIANIASHVADNLQEQNTNEVERVIKSAGEEGISQSRLLRRFRKLRKKDLVDIADALVQQGSVEAAQIIGTGGRPAVFYRGAQSDTAT